MSYFVLQVSLLKIGCSQPNFVGYIQIGTYKLTVNFNHLNTSDLIKFCCLQKYSFLLFSNFPQFCSDCLNIISQYHPCSTSFLLNKFLWVTHITDCVAEKNDNDYLNDIVNYKLRVIYTILNTSFSLCFIFMFTAIYEGAIFFVFHFCYSLFLY